MYYQITFLSSSAELLSVELFPFRTLDSWPVKKTKSSLLIEKKSSEFRLYLKNKQHLQILSVA